MTKTDQEKFNKMVIDFFLELANENGKLKLRLEKLETKLKIKPKVKS